MQDWIEYKQYILLRKNIFVGNLYYQKNELIHVLYRIFLKIINIYFSKYDKNIINELQYKTDIINLNELSKDFFNYKLYKDDLNYLINIINGYFNYKILKDDKYYNDIVNSSYYVFLSKNSYNSLLSFLKATNFKYIWNIISQKTIIKIIIINNISEESYLNSYGVKVKLNYDLIKDVNSYSITMGMLREDYNLIQKLEDLYVRKHSKNFKYINRFLNNNFKKYPIEKAFNSILTNTPDVKIKYKYDFSKDFWNKVPIELSEKINILKLDWVDNNNKINVWEISKDFKLIIMGYDSGKIKLYELSNNLNLYYNNLKKEEGEDKENKEENNESEEKIDTNFEIEKKMNIGITRLNDFENHMFVQNELKTAIFLGHTFPIVTIDINYDNNYFISGDLDGDIRLWDPNYNNCIGLYKIHNKSIWDLDLSPKGYYFLSCSEDGLGYLWNLNKNYPIKKYEFYKSIPKICKITYNLLYGLFATYDNSIYLFSLEDSNLVRYFENSSEINTININYTGDTLFLGNANGTISILNLENLKLEKIINLENTSDSLRNINISIDENFIWVTTKNRICFYKMNDLRSTNSTNIFQNYEYNDKSKINSIQPFKTYYIEDLDLINSLINNQNIVFVINRISN